jgi:hypothetical protein
MQYYDIDPLVSQAILLADLQLLLKGTAAMLKVTWRGLRWDGGAV